MNPWEMNWSQPQAGPQTAPQRPVINITPPPRPIAPVPVQSDAPTPPWERDWSSFDQQGLNAPGGIDAAFRSFAGMQVDPALRQRGEDLSQVGERYGLTDPQQIIAADRQAAGMQGQFSGISNAALQGATFGLGDEVKAATGALFGSGGYGQNLAGEREGVRRFARDNPVTATVAELGGALVTAPFLPTASIGTGATLASRVGSGLLTGAGYGAAYGFGTGEGGAAERVTNAATGAGFGAGVGAAAPAILSGIGSFGRGVNAIAGNPVGVVRGLVNPDAEAARRVAVGLSRDNGGAPQQALRDAGTALDSAGYPSVLADMGGETTRALARSAANTSPEGRQAIQTVTQNRFETAGQRTEDLITDIMGGRGNNVQRQEVLKEAAQRANRPLYERAYREAEGGIWNADLEALVQAPAVQAAIRGATARGQNRAVIEGVGPIRNPFITDASGNLVLGADQAGNRALPNLRFWDVVKRNLDSEIGKAHRAGDNTSAADLTVLKQQLLGTLDQASPTYARARATAASFFGAEDALGAGESFVTSRMANDEARAALAKMKPEERALFAEGFATGLVSRLREVRDRVNVTNQIFGSPAARERIAMALGPERAARIETFVRRENALDLLRQAMGNSTTARQLQEIGLAGGAGALVSGGDLMDPRALLTAAAVYGGRRGAAKIDERVARRVADLLVTDDPKVVARAVKAITGSSGLSRALRSIEDNLAKVVSPAGVNGNSLPGLLTPGRAEKDNKEYGR